MWLHLLLTVHLVFSCRERLIEIAGEENDLVCFQVDQLVYREMMLTGV